MHAAWLAARLSYCSNAARVGGMASYGFCFLANMSCMASSTSVVALDLSYIQEHQVFIIQHGRRSYGGQGDMYLLLFGAEGTDYALSPYFLKRVSARVCRPTTILVIIFTWAKLQINHVL